MLELQHVSFQYEPGKPVLEDLSCQIPDGEAVGIIGANGSGKTTLMKLLLGLLPCDGQIFVDGLPVSKKNLPAIRRRLGYVLQDSDNQLFMPTVYEDMCFGLRNGGMDAAAAEARVDETLARLDLTHLKHSYNHKLSGGEKRMAAIATILVMEPETIILDEPSNALDPYNRRLVIQTIQALPQTKLIVSHDLDLVWETCTRVLLLTAGRLIADGPAQVLLQDKALLEKNRLELPLRFQGA